MNSAFPLGSATLTLQGPLTLLPSAAGGLDGLVRVDQGAVGGDGGQAQGGRTAGIGDGDAPGPDEALAGARSRGAGLGPERGGPDDERAAGHNEKRENEQAPMHG